VKAHPFEPIIFSDSQTLILGFFPTAKDISNGFYHTAKNDKFWQLLSLVSNYPINNNDQKIWLLKESKLALWDILSHKQTTKSNNFTIEDELVNDISSILEHHPTISTVALMTKRVEAIYNHYFEHLQLEQILLSSSLSNQTATSPQKQLNSFKRLIK